MSDKKDEQIQKILDNVVAVKFEGRPIPIWEEKQVLSDLMKQFNVPGIGIVLINNFEIEWSKFIGVQDLNSKKEVNSQTLFEAASTTKALVAVAALHYVENGLLDLDTDVNEYLKDWKIPESEFTKKEKVTLRRLLTHSAGINPPDSNYSYKEGSSPSLLDVLKGQSPAINDPVKLVFEPGSKHQYSNLAFNIIQKILEDVAGKPFTQLMKEIIFDPIEMKNSTLEYPLPDEMNERAILHHTAEGEVKGKGLHPAAMAQGNLSCNPIDLAKFVVEIMKAYHGKSEKIISQETAKSIFTSYKSFGPTELMGFTDQALGFFLIKNDKDTFFLHPGGNLPGANCMLLGSALTGQGVIIMSNAAMGELLNMRLTYTLAKEYDWNFG
ncbi:MAG: beta-lactamase family protein [Asgard group archaeon]|nr:beta-lactamase family protein [Asgard group archaeon]